MFQYDNDPPVPRAVQERWIRQYALIVLVLGGLSIAFLLGTARTRGFGADEGCFVALYVGFVALAVTRAPARVIAFYVLAALAIAEVLSVVETGFRGPPALLFCTLPVLSAVFFGPRSAYLATGGGLAAFAIVGTLRVRGVLLSPVNPRLLDTGSFRNWLGVTAAFGAVVGPSVWLVARLMQELDSSLRELELARVGHEAQVRLRVAAEDALAKAVERRERARQGEAEGLLIGGVVHDLRNTLAVLSMWSSSLEVDAEADAEVRDASARIDAACADAARMTAELLAVARPRPVVQLGAVGPPFEAALAVLQRSLPRDVLVVATHDVDPDTEVAFDPAAMTSIILALAASVRFGMAGRAGLRLLLRRPSDREKEAMPGTAVVVELAFEGVPTLPALDPALGEEATEQGGRLFFDSGDDKHPSSMRLLLAAVQARDPRSGPPDPALGAT